MFNSLLTRIGNLPKLIFLDEEDNKSKEFVKKINQLKMAIQDYHNSKEILGSLISELKIYIVDENFIVRCNK